MTAIGKTYEELEVGEEASFSKTITETDVYLFAGISGDFNPLHVDESYAKGTVFGTRIAHGALPQSLIAPVLGMKLPGLGTILVEIACRFKRPTFFGDTVTATATVAEKIEKTRWVRLKLKWTNQRGESVAEGDAVVVPPQKTPPLVKGDRGEAYRSVKETFEKMPGIFNAEAAKKLHAMIQFEITGKGGGNWVAFIKDGKCQIQEGSHDSPAAKLTMSGKTLLAIVNKKTSGMESFISGNLRASGDIILAQRIPDLFSF
jgi:acyl dehydratase/putative sterol carrier protein